MCPVIFMKKGAVLFKNSSDSILNFFNDRKNHRITLCLVVYKFCNIAFYIIFHHRPIDRMF